MSYKVYVQRVLDNYDPMDGKAVEEQRARTVLVEPVEHPTIEEAVNAWAGLVAVGQPGQSVVLVDVGGASVGDGAHFRAQITTPPPGQHPTAVAFFMDYGQGTPVDTATTVGAAAAAIAGMYWSWEQASPGRDESQA